jgi:hypothetical protein
LATTVVPTAGFAVDTLKEATGCFGAADPAEVDAAKAVAEVKTVSVAAAPAAMPEDTTG